VKLNRTTLVFLFAVISTGFVAPGPARAQFWNSNNESSLNQMRSFDAFLQNHPSIAKKLSEKPQRVNDRGFLNGNKELKQWLEDHPVAARVFHDDPVDFMARERHFQLYGRDLAAANGPRNELARFDWFLDNHPDIRRDLTKHPELARKPGYLEHHAELEEFLDRHPGVREELQDRPKEFMEREEGYQRSL
jgi:phage-related protein